MPRKKSTRRSSPSRRPGGLISPLRAGGRALGDLQVPYRRFLEAETEQDGSAMPVADVEARLMESLGWLLLDQGDVVVPNSATVFSAEELQGLFTQVVPAVAEHNGLDAQELVDETRVAWTTYLMFLGESGTWQGEPDDLADCLDVASGGVGGTAAGEAGILEALEAVATGVSPQAELADLSSVPVVAAGFRALDALAAGVEFGARPDLVDGPGMEALRSALGDELDQLDPVALLLDWMETGTVEFSGGRSTVPLAADPGRALEQRCAVGSAVLSQAVTRVLAESATPGAVVGALSVVASSVLDPMTSGSLRELLTADLLTADPLTADGDGPGGADDVAAATATVQRLVEAQVLSPVEPWTARAGLSRAVLDVVATFFDTPVEDDGGQDDGGQDDGGQEDGGQEDGGQEDGAVQAAPAGG